MRRRRRRVDDQDRGRWAAIHGFVFMSGLIQFWRHQATARPPHLYLQLDNTLHSHNTSYTTQHHHTDTSNWTIHYDTSNWTTLNITIHSHITQYITNNTYTSNWTIPPTLQYIYNTYIKPHLYLQLDISQHHNKIDKPYNTTTLIPPNGPLPTLQYIHISDTIHHTPHNTTTLIPPTEQQSTFENMSLQCIIHNSCSVFLITHHSPFWKRPNQNYMHIQKFPHSKAP